METNRNGKIYMKTLCVASKKHVPTRVSFSHSGKASHLVVNT